MADKIQAPCVKDCPDRSAECHAHCEKYLEYEKARNEKYKRDAFAKDVEAFLNRRERERKSDIVTGRMTQRRRKK